MTERSPGLQKALERAGGVSALARLLNLHRQQVSAWRKVPPKRIAEVSKVTRLSEKFLWSDFVREAAE